MSDGLEERIVKQRRTPPPHTGGWTVLHGLACPPEVVCLCGSTRFKEAYRSENERLSLEGKIVLSVGLFGHADGVELTGAEKEGLDELHKRKIDLADRVHVINVNGYVGESTRSEIEYARGEDKEVTWLNDELRDSPPALWKVERDGGWVWFRDEEVAAQESIGQPTHELWEAGDMEELGPDSEGAGEIRLLYPRGD